MLVPNWRVVLKHAWSVRLNVLALLVVIIEPVYAFAASAWVSRNIYIQLSMQALVGVLTAGAILARIYLQRKVSGDINGRPPEER